MSDLYYKLVGTKVVATNDIKEAFGKDVNRSVKQTEIRDAHVSTVILGVDHGHPENPEKPLVFETMVFCEDETNEMHYYMDRYYTYDEAVKGHDVICKKVIDSQKYGLWKAVKLSLRNIWREIKYTVRVWKEEIFKEV